MDQQIYQLTGRPVALTDIVPTQDSAGASAAGGSTVQQIGEAAGAITKKITLTSAQILALNGTPITLVAAPGAGKIVKLLACSLQGNFGTVAYATNTTLRVKVGSLDQQFVGGSFLAFSANSYTEIARSTSTASGISGVANQPAQIYAASGNPTAGDGTVDVYITYQIASV